VKLASLIINNNESNHLDLPLYGVSDPQVLWGLYTDGSAAPLTQGVVWSSAESSVVSVSPNNGVVTATGLGDANVMASFGGLSTTTPLTVKVTAALDSIELSAESTSLVVGQQTAVTAIGHFNDGSTEDLSSKVTLDFSNTNLSHGASSNIIVAESSAFGGGTTEVTASYLGKTSTVPLEIHILPLAVDSISLAADFESLVVTTSKPVTVIGHYNDGSEHDLSQEVQLHFSNNNMDANKNVVKAESSVYGPSECPECTDVYASYPNVADSNTMTLKAVPVAPVSLDMSKGYNGSEPYDCTILVPTLGVPGAVCALYQIYNNGSKKIIHYSDLNLADFTFVDVPADVHDPVVGSPGLAPTNSVGFDMPGMSHGESIGVTVNYQGLTTTQYYYYK